MFDFLFGKKPQPAAPQPVRSHPPAPRAVAAPAAPAAPVAAAPGTHISYHPELIGELKADHRVLLGLYTAIGTSHAEGRFTDTADLLEQFRIALSGHLLTESVRFYIYLEHALASDESSKALVHEFRHEMDGIGKAVLKFLDKHRHIGENPAGSPHFAEELGAVGKVLSARIASEESTLYALYLPAY